MEKKVFKIKISSAKFPALMASEWAAYRSILGDLQIVKIKQCFGGLDIIVWAVRK